MHFKAILSEDPLAQPAIELFLYDGESEEYESTDDAYMAVWKEIYAAERQVAQARAMIEDWERCRDQAQENLLDLRALQEKLANHL